MLLRDILGRIYQDSAFKDCYPKRGQPAKAPWRFAAIFGKSLRLLSGRVLTSSCIDWKYTLGLALTDPGFHPTVR